MKTKSQLNENIVSGVLSSVMKKFGLSNDIINSAMPSIMQTIVPFMQQNGIDPKMVGNLLSNRMVRMMLAGVIASHTGLGRMQANQLIQAFAQALSSSNGQADANAQNQEQPQNQGQAQPQNQGQGGGLGSLLSSFKGWLKECAERDTKAQMVRITESDIRAMVAECVRRTLNEARL